MAGGKRDSFEKFNYLLRPSKQVERKLLIEAFHCMRADGYEVAKYTYLGFGSVFYADFLLFHKYLLMEDMICVEASDIPKRMKFNKPYDFIKLKMGAVAKHIPGLDRKRKYLVWLDYDSGLSDEKLEDIRGLLGVLAPGSILLITLDAEPKLRNVIDYTEAGEDERDFSQRQVDDLLFSSYSEHFNKYVAGGVLRADISRNGLPPLVVKVLQSTVRTSLVGRPELRFGQLFNFVYADGAQMVTFGGILDKVAEVDRMAQSHVSDLNFINPGTDPLKISVPQLTLREKLWLDQNLDKAHLKFELDPEYVSNYKRFYRQYPVYNEALL